MKRSVVGWLLVGAAAAIGLWCYSIVFAAPSRPRPLLPAASINRSTAATHKSRRGATVSAPVSGTPQKPPNYGSAIREGLFSAPQPKADPTPAVPPVQPRTVVIPPAPPSDPLADAEYSGSVTVDGKTTALIQSRSTKLGDYVEAGGQWNGLQIVSVTPQMLTIMVNGAPRALPVSDSFNLVPLSASAPTAQQSAVPGQAVAAGGAPAAAGMADQAAAFLKRRAEAMAMRESSQALKYSQIEQEYSKKLQLTGEK